MTLLLFNEWKADNKLTNVIIISNGEITPFLEHKKLTQKDKALYLTKEIWDDKQRTFVAYEKMKGERKEEYPNTYKFELLQAFIPYLDWLKGKGKTQKILNINSRSAPKHEM